MEQTNLLLPALCIVISGLLCLSCLILPVVFEVGKKIKMLGQNIAFYKLLLSILVGDILHLSVHLILDVLTISAPALLDYTERVETVTLFFMGIGYRSMVIGTILIGWNRMQKFCITLKCKPLKWFKSPKPLIWLTWILSVAVTLVQLFVGCNIDFDPGALSFHRSCINRIYKVILNGLSLLGLILILTPYMFIIREIIRLRKLSHQVQPTIVFSVSNPRVHATTTPTLQTHVAQNLQSQNAEIRVSLQAVLMGVILISTHASLVFVDFGRGILALMMSQYSMIILCSYTSVLSLIFCEDIRLGVKSRFKKLFCKSNH